VRERGNANHTRDVPLAFSNCCASDSRLSSRLTSACSRANHISHVSRGHYSTRFKDVNDREHGKVLTQIVRLNYERCVEFFFLFPFGEGKHTLRLTAHRELSLSTIFSWNGECGKCNILVSVNFRKRKRVIYYIAITVCYITI